MQLTPCGDGASHEGEQLRGGVGVERGGRLVQNDEAHRLIGRGEGTRHFDHLAPPDRKVLNQIGGADAMTGKDLVKLVHDQGAGRCYAS